jgi:tetratricopeptide (TPR) repeat protein
LIIFGLKKEEWVNVNEETGSLAALSGRPNFGAAARLALALAALAIFCLPSGAQENTTDYWMEKAQELYHNGSIEEAISAYDEALNIDPENETILIRKAFDLMVVGKVNESAETYEKALALLDEDLEEDPGDAEAWQNKALVLRRLNRPEEAAQAYEEALGAFDQRIETDPKDADAWTGRANVLLNLGRWDEASEAYDWVTELKPQDYNVWWRKAEVISRIGDMNESVEAYDKAISLIPANDTAELALAYAAKSEDLAAAERWEDALEAVDKSLELNPKSGTWWHFKAFILTELERKEEALAAFDEAIRQNPEDVGSWQWKASLLVGMKRYDESLEAYDEALQLIPESDAETLAQTWLSKGTALNKTGKQGEATEAFARSLALYEEAIMEDPGDIVLLQTRGRALYELGRYDESLEVYDQILESSPGVEPHLVDTTAWIGRGDALRALGRNQEALEAYNRAIELGPHYSTAWHGRGEAQRGLGQVYNATMSLLVADKLGYEE